MGKTIYTGRRRVFTIYATLSANIAYGGSFVWNSLFDPPTGDHGFNVYGRSNANITSMGGFVVPSLSFSINDGGLGSPSTRTILASGVGSGISVQVTADRPANPGYEETTFSGPQYLTSNATISITYHLVEIEDIVDGYSSRLFREVLATDVDSTFTATMSCGGQSITDNRTMRGSGEPLSTLSCTAGASVAAQRMKYSNVIQYLSTWYGPSYSVTGTYSLTQTVAGCDFAPVSSPSASSPSSSAGGGFATATAPSNEARASSASSGVRIRQPKMTVNGYAARRDLAGALLPSPYAGVSGTAYFGYRINELNTFTEPFAFDLSAPAEKTFVFGEGVTDAYAEEGGRSDNVTSPPQVVSGTGLVTIDYPYPSDIPPAGIEYGQAGRPGLCAMSTSGTPDGFKPEIPAVAYRDMSNSVSLSGANITHAGVVRVAQTPFLTGGALGGSWTITGGGTLTDSGGRLVIAASAGGSSIATLRFGGTFDVISIAYRYLKIRFHASSAFSAPLNMYQFSNSTLLLSTAINAQIGAGELVIDLLRFVTQIEAAPLNDGATAAILTLHRLLIEVPAGKTLEIEYIEWFRQVGTTINITPVTSGTNPPLLIRHLPAFAGFVDGMPSRCVPRSMARPINFLAITAKTTNETGWSAVYVGPGTQSNSTSNDLQEAGLFNGSQPLFDAPLGVYRGARTGHGVLAYPGCGDVLGQGAYGAEMEVRWDQFSGSQITATVVGGGESPTLTARRESDSAFRSSAIFNAAGEVRYLPLSPVFQPVDTTVTTSDKTVSRVINGAHGLVSGLSLRWTPTSGARAWFAFVIDNIVLWLSMDASATGRLVQATTDAAGKIMLRLPSLFGVGAWAETVTTITGMRPTARYARHRASGELVLYYEAGGGISRITTADEGGTFGMATTVTAAGKYPAACMTPTGAEAVAWWVTGGSVKFRTFDAFGAAITSEVTAVASGVAEDAIALAGRSDGSLVLSYRNTANAIITVVSADGGQTWA